MPQTTLEAFRFSPPLAVMQRVGRWADSARITIIDLDPDRLVTAAERQTGLRDWGDPAFLRDYRVLMEAVASNRHNLSFLGKYGMRLEIMRVLTVRLRMVALMAARSEIAQTPIRRPLFIVGLPRTGTTLLHKLFQCDSHFRVAPFWQFYSPFPLTDQPLPARVPEVERRIRTAESIERQARTAIPAMNTIHPVEAHAPEECVFLLPHHMVMHMRAGIPTYSEWLLTRNLLADYAYHKNQLQSLSFGSQSVNKSARWVLKAPFHLFSLPELFATYPDAGIIQTHRDPKDVIGSWCSFAAVVAKAHRNQTDVSAVAQEWIGLWRIALQRAIEFRERQPGGTFYDLHYHELAADPIETMRRLYAHFGDELSADTEARMQIMLAQGEQSNGKKPPYTIHRYNLAQFGLKDADIDAAFDFYVTHFNIRLERSGELNPVQSNSI